MTIQDLRQIESVIADMRRKYGKLPELAEIIRLSKSGIISLDEALDRVSEYEAHYGHKIAREYDERKYRE